MIFDYPSKKVMKENVGQPLRYQETSMFGNQFVRTGTMTGCNRPHLTGHSREFFAQVIMQDGLIAKVL
jgi:hypothetical protein